MCPNFRKTCFKNHHFYRVKKIAIAGIAGTLAKTLLSYISSFAEDEQVKEPEVLGTMLTMQADKTGSTSKSIEALTVGYTAHFLTGIGFATCYDLLWRWEIGKPNLKYGLIFGSVNGLVGASIWRAYLNFHSYPPKIPVKLYIRNLLIDHVLFGVTIAYTYKYLDKLCHSETIDN